MPNLPDKHRCSRLLNICGDFSQNGCAVVKDSRLKLFDACLARSYHSEYKPKDLGRFAFLQKFRGVVPLNVEWRDVHVEPKSGAWPSVIRKELVDYLSAFLKKDKANNKEFQYTSCILLVGAESIGRTTAIRHAIDCARDTTKTIPIEFDFKDVNQRSFSPFLIEFYDSIISQLLPVTKESGFATGVSQMPKFVFDSMKSKFFDFPRSFEHFMADIATQNYPTAYASIPEVIKLSRDFQIGFQKDESSVEKFKRLCQTLDKSEIWSGNPSRSSTLGSCASLLLSIGEYEENVEAYRKTNGRLQWYPTGEKSLRYLLVLISTLQKSLQKPLSLCLIFKNVEVLSRSPFLQERGYSFLSLLVNLLVQDEATDIMRQQHPLAFESVASEATFRSKKGEVEMGLANDLRSFVTTDDSMMVFRLIQNSHTPALSLQQQNSQNHKKMKKKHLSSSDAAADWNVAKPMVSNVPEEILVPTQKRLKVVDVTEWPKVLAGKIFSSYFTDSPVVFSGVFDSVGGHPKYLKTMGHIINRSDQEMAEQLLDKSNALIKEIRTLQEELTEVKYNAPAQAKVDFEKLRRQQYAVRESLGTEFPEQLLYFQWKINHFLSLPVIEKLRYECKSKVTFLVTVLESIRLLLTKSYWTLNETQLIQLQHPVALGLLDARIFRIEFSPIRLTPYDTLSRNLLRSYINEKFENLSCVNRMKYNATYMANQKQLQTRLAQISRT